jgi:hypothetical protein
MVKVLWRKAWDRVGMKRGRFVVRYVVKLDILQFKVPPVSTPLICQCVFVLSSAILVLFGYHFPETASLRVNAATHSPGKSARTNLLDSLSLSSVPIPLRTM